MAALTTQSTTPATIPSGTQVAADQVGTANAPAAGDRIQYVKLDAGVAGASDPITRTNPLPVISGPILTYKGRANTFRTIGRAGTTGQKLLSLHNASGSTTIVRITKAWIDLYATVIKAVTVAPPSIRIHRVTVLPTNGTALAKVSRDTALTSSGSVTLLQDAASETTLSATALTATIPANSILTQEYAPRLITAAGYEMFDRAEFLDGTDDEVVLRALEGVVLLLDYSLATQNPATDIWACGIEWTEAAS